MSIQASILAVSIWGPGLEGWPASRPILAGEMPYQPRPSPAPPPVILPPTERRRAGPVIRLALAVAQEAAAASGLDPATLPSIFASSNGDGVIIGGILQALARAADNERVVSPTQFHNSVHNAPAGYWSIAHASRQPATSLGAHDWTWPAALLKSIAEITSESHPLLLCCYDHPMPPPLDALRPVSALFGAALVLAPLTPGYPNLSVTYSAAAPALAPSLGPVLDTLMAGNPAARTLPLLVALARGKPAHLQTPYLDGHLNIVFQP